jgi:hypothetical protein
MIPALRALVAAVALALAAPLAWGQTTATVNTPPGSIWTYLGPTFGADWVFPPPAGGALTPQTHGCIGDGVTDDTLCMQNAINAATAQGVALRVDDGYHKYKITASLTATSGILDLEGTNGNQGAYNDPGCTSGFVSGFDGDLLKITIPVYTVRRICFQMAPVPGGRHGGLAISVGTASSSMGGGVIEYNSIVNPYEGIGLASDAAGTQKVCQNTYILYNTVYNPLNIGIVLGRNSVNDGCGDTTMIANFVSCNRPAVANATGIDAWDGDVHYEGGQSGPLKCRVGFKISPGVGNSLVGQNFNGQFSGVLGDSSGTLGGSNIHDFWITTGSPSSVVGFVELSNAWASGGTIPNGDVPVLIENPGGGVVTDILINGLTARTAGTSTIMQVNGNVLNLTLNGSRLCAWNNGAVTNGLVLNFAGNIINEGHYVITGNQIGACEDYSGAAMTNGIVINPNGGTGNSNNWIVITGNDLSSTTNPIVYPPAAQLSTNNDVIIQNNLGVDDTNPAITSASTMALPHDGRTNYIVVGGTNIDRITGGTWLNRPLRIAAATNPVVFNANAGGAGVNCLFTPVTIPVGAVGSFYWNNAGSCWAHVQ